MSGRHPDDQDYHRGDPRRPSRREQPRERDPRRGELPKERRTIEEYADRDTRMSEAMDSRIDPRMEIDPRMADPRMDPRLDPRMDPRMDPRLDPRMDPRLDPRMDPRIDPRIDPRDSRLDNRLDIQRDPRTNTVSRIDPRSPPERTLERTGADSEGEFVLIRDPATGQVYREVRNAPSRGAAYPRDERDYNAPPRSRPAMDTAMWDREQLKPELGEYFCPGDGIERDVIQHEICKYLGQDATCRPGTKEGRLGFWVRAYRPFTTAMERSLREETVRWQREKERRRKQGESRGSYAEMADQLESRRRYPAEMDVDEDDFQRQPPRHRDLDPRDSRGGRPSVPVPVAASSTSPAYNAQYAISSGPPGYPSGQAPYYPSDREPRSTTFNPGHTTPPAAMSRPNPPGGGFVQPPGFAPRPGPPVPSSTPTAYGDSRRDMMGAPPPGYTDRRK